MFENIFSEIGRKAGTTYKKGKWIYSTLLGSEEEAVKAEFSIGYEMAKSFAKEATITKNDIVKDIGDKLKENIDSNYRFNFYVINSDQPNAFAFPGGFIFITESLLNLCGNDRDEIAFILGHEIAHVIKGHAIERILAEYSITTVANLIATKGMIFGAVKSLSKKYILSAYSRENEYEADLFSVKIIKKCGFNSKSAQLLLKRLKNEDKPIFDYFKSHPQIADRIDKLSKECD